MKTTNHTLKKFTALTIAVLLALSALAGCGSSENTEDGVQKIAVGAPLSAGDWASLDENGELDGYEIAVLKAVDERLPQYEFEITGTDFNNILLSLDTGKIDLGAFLFEYNEERAAKYDFATVGYVNFSTYLIFPADAQDVSLAGLAGKIVGSKSEGDNVSNTIKKYNESHPDQAPIELDVYGEISDEVRIASFLEGRWDALYGVTWEADRLNEEFGNGKDIVKRGDIINDSLSYYLYPKDGAHDELKAAVDGALKELIEDGTLKEISDKYFGYDVTPAVE